MATNPIDGDYLSSLAINPQQNEPRRAELGQDDFLELMITQFQNQDPFKPLDADQMLGQLAQFSTVAGLSEVKNQIESLSSSLLADQSLQASSLVGRGVLVPSDRVLLDPAQGAGIGVLVPENAQQVSVSIVDAAGRTVDTVELGAMPAGIAHFTWDGIMSDGAPAPAGTYAVKAFGLAGGPSTALETYAGATVTSVSLARAGGSTTVNLGALGSFEFGDVVEVYD
jgi:flagellar basal-body rod modification protein FlgD